MSLLKKYFYTSVRNINDIRKLFSDFSNYIDRSGDILVDTSLFGTDRQCEQIASTNYFVDFILN